MAIVPPPPMLTTWLPLPSQYAHCCVLQLAGRDAAVVKFQIELPRFWFTQMPTLWYFGVEVTWILPDPVTISWLLLPLVLPSLQKAWAPAVVPGRIEWLGGRQNHRVRADRAAQQRGATGHAQRARVGRQVQVGGGQVTRRRARRCGAGQAQLARERGRTAGIFSHRCRIDGCGVARVPVVDIATVSRRRCAG